MSAAPGQGPSGRDQDPVRAGHASGAAQPDPTWGWDVAGEPIDEADGWRPVPPGVDPMADPDRREAWLAAADSGEAPPDPEQDPGWCPDPEDSALPDEVDLDALRAESRRIAAGRAAEQAAEAEWAARLPRDADIPQAGMKVGRRGPGMPGSARRVPGEYAGPAGGFGTGQPLDVAPGGGVLLGFAEDAAGAGDRFAGASDDELAGVIGALDRAEAAACSLKHAALAEFTRRRPAPGCAVAGAARLPAEREEFAGDEVAQLLAEGRGAAEGMLDLARDLEVKLPGTKAAFRAGTLRHAKAQVIAWATAMLDPGEARAAEEQGAGPGGAADPGRAAVGDRPGGDGGGAGEGAAAAGGRGEGRPGAAVGRGQRERGAGGPGTAPRRGPRRRPADLLVGPAAKKAGLAGSMDELRARAYLDLLLDKDSRPAAPADGTTDTSGTAALAAPAAPRTPAAARAAAAGTVAAVVVGQAVRGPAGQDPRSRWIRSRR